MTQQTGAGGQDAAIKAVVQTNAMGFLNGSAGLAYISVTYHDAKTGAGRGRGEQQQRRQHLRGLGDGFPLGLFRSGVAHRRSQFHRHFLRRHGISAEWSSAVTMSMIHMTKTKRTNRRGSTILEFAIVAPFLIVALLGVAGFGISLGRYIQALQVCRDVAHMFVDGVDFTQAGNQALIVLMAQGSGMTATGGNGVVIMSRISTVYQADCDAASYSGSCNNAGPGCIYAAHGGGQHCAARQRLRYAERRHHRCRGKHFNQRVPAKHRRQRAYHPDSLPC